MRTSLFVVLCRDLSSNDVDGVGFEFQAGAVHPFGAWIAVLWPKSDSLFECESVFRLYAFHWEFEETHMFEGFLQLAGQLQFAAQSSDEFSPLVGLHLCLQREGAGESERLRRFRLGLGFDVICWPRIRGDFSQWCGFNHLSCLFADQEALDFARLVVDWKFRRHGITYFAFGNNI